MLNFISILDSTRQYFLTGDTFKDYLNSSIHQIRSDTTITLENRHATRYLDTSNRLLEFVKTRKVEKYIHDLYLYYKTSLQNSEANSKIFADRNMSLIHSTPSLLLAKRPSSLPNLGDDEVYCVT